MLIISGKRVLADIFPDFSGKQRELRQERRQGHFMREIQLPTDAHVKPGTIQAKVVEGVLEVTVERAWGSQVPDTDDKSSFMTSRHFGRWLPALARTGRMACAAVYLAEIAPEIAS